MRLGQGGGLAGRYGAKGLRSSFFQQVQLAARVCEEPETRTARRL